MFILLIACMKMKILSHLNALYCHVHGLQSLLHCPLARAGDQVKKYGAEAADKISHINAKQAEAEGGSEIKKLQKEVSWQSSEACSEERPSRPCPA